MSEPRENEVLKQRKYNKEIEEALQRELQETQRREERQRKYTQEEANRLREQAEQSQKDDK
jgi:hypothetical protein